MAPVTQQVVLGAVCVVMQFAFARAFLPSASLSTSSFQHASVRHADAGEGRRTETAMRSGKHDLYVVGAGHLGKEIGAQWHEQHPEAIMYGETRSITQHEDHMPEGMEHTRRQLRDGEGITCPNVVFCANPGGNKDYAMELFYAMEDIWDGTGAFVYTSSGGLYAEKDGGVVTEDSPVDVRKLATGIRVAEKICMKNGGTVMRLAGLYSEDRGPHNVWLNMSKLEQHSASMINLISYDDAAGAVVATLHAGMAERREEEGAPEVIGKTFLAADDTPMTRRRICELALTHPLHERKKMPMFVGDQSHSEFIQTGPTKVYDTSLTRRTLGWQPKYPSMEDYFKAAGHPKLYVQRVVAPVIEKY